MAANAQRRLTKLAVVIAIGLAIWFSPHPEQVSDQAWHLLAIFTATVAGLILQPLPMGAVAIAAIAITPLTQTLTIKEALTGFSNTTIWLIVVAMLLSRSIIKCNLGARIGYLFMSLLGKHSLSLSYGLITTDLILAPAIPSNTARSGGIIYPLVSAISNAYGSDPEQNTQRKIGAFLVKSCFQGTVITSAMFLTAMAANPLAAKLAAQMGINISWGLWALAALVPGLVSLITIPLVLYKLYPPEISHTPKAPELAKKALEEFGPMSTQEWIVLGTFISLILLWIFGSQLGVHSTTAALLGLTILLVTQVLSWQDILHEKNAWDTLVWFSALVMMASYLNQLGLIGWFSETVGHKMEGFSWHIAFFILILLYFYSHYLFASNTAHVSAMYAAFVAVSVSTGTPPLLAALVFAFCSNLFASMTHYGTGPAPVLFGSGHVSLNDWWRLGFIISVINLIIWLTIGMAWWKLLGIW